MKKLIFIVAGLSSLVAIIAWLWTLQPQPKNVLPASDSNTSGNGSRENQSPYEPKDGSVVQTAKVKLKGKTVKENFVVVSSGPSYIARADASGSYTQDIELQKGLNLVKITSITSDLQKSEEQVLTYYLDAGISAPNVWAGPVNAIFDTLITITTSAGEVPVRAGKSTSIIVPEEEDAEGTQGAPIKQIRIGDYAIALGVAPKTESESPLVEKITILRDNKPTIDAQVIVAKTLNNVKANTLTVKSKDKSIDLTLNKNTEVTIGGKTAKAADIAKDKNAIVVYRAQDDDNLADLIYII